jgi:hypothetical protein
MTYKEKTTRLEFYVQNYGKKKNYSKNFLYIIFKGIKP